MKKILPLLFLTLSLFGQTNVQKDKDKKLSNGSIIVGDGTSITATGTGIIAATSIPGLTISTTAPLAGGGSLASNLTLSLSFASPLTNNAGTLTLPLANTTTSGYLSSTDWNTFNGKQGAGNYLTALTGDVSAAGPGSSVATLATVASAGTTGSSTVIPVITIDAKGRTTSISTAAVVAPAGTLTGTTLASNVVTSSLTTVGTIGTGTWQGSTVATGFGGTGLTSFTSGGVMQATSGSVLTTTLSPAGLTSVGTAAVSASGNLTLSGGSSGASAVLTTGANGQITVPEFQPFYFTPFSGDAPWRVFTSDLGGSDTTDQVLHLASNTRYLSGAWQTRDVANLGAAIFSLESNYTAGAGGVGSFEWNLDFANPGTGAPSFTTRALGFAHNWTTTANTWDFGPTGGASTFTFRGPLSVVYSNSNARQLTVNSTDNGIAALQLTSNAKSWHVENRGGNNSNALYIGSTDFDPAIAISETTGAVTLNSTTASTTSVTGALIVGGGAGISGAINSAGAITSSGATANARWLATTSTDNTIAGILLTSNTKTWHIDHRGGTNTNQLWIGSGSFDPAIAVTESSGDVKLNSTTASTTTTSGALQVIGGVGIGGALNIGSTIDASVGGGSFTTPGGFYATKTIWAGTGFVGLSLASPSGTNLSLSPASSSTGFSGGYVDIVSNPTDGTYTAPLRFGQGSRYSLTIGTTTFSSVADHSGGIYYNSQKASGDAAFGLGFESAFKNSTHYDTEFYYAWSGVEPGETGASRPIQINVSWGPGYSTDGLAAGFTQTSLSASKFGIVPGGGFGENGFFLNWVPATPTMYWNGVAEIASTLTLDNGALKGGTGGLSLQAGGTSQAIVLQTSDGSGVEHDALSLNTNGRMSHTPSSAANVAWGTTGTLFAQAAATITDSSTSGSGTVATAVFSSFAAPTLAATNTSVTTTDAATLYIAGGPSAGTHETITNSWGLWNVGDTKLGGKLAVTGRTTSAQITITSGDSTALQATTSGSGNADLFTLFAPSLGSGPNYGNFRVGTAASTGNSWNIEWQYAGSGSASNRIGLGFYGVGDALTITRGSGNLGIVAVLDTTASSSTSTGALVVSGGQGIAGDVHAGGNLYADTAGKTLSVKSGTNAAAGTVTLVAGAATITSTAIDANTVIVFSEKTAGGTPGIYQPLAAVTSGSAAVTSAATDTSTYNWVAMKVN